MYYCMFKASYIIGWIGSIQFCKVDAPPDMYDINSNIESTTTLINNNREPT